MKDIAIRVENLSKLYHIGHLQRRHDTLREALVGAITNLKNRYRTASPEDIIWALRDINFDVKVGEVVGIIGRNGAGKSTILKILSQITEPTFGRAIVNGKVSSLLEVGTGFHPELTGRENIYLNGAIMGMRRREIDQKFDEIVAFSEIEKFLDTPVKRYSSGMYVRLAFSVAAHMEPEILIVDEVLAVGDISFQKKCLGKMEDVSKGGRTVLFVSHNMQAIGDLCTNAILLENGHIVMRDTPSTVIKRYLVGAQKTVADFSLKKWQSSNFLIDQINIFGNTEDDPIKPLGELNINVDVTPLQATRDLSLHYIILDEDHSRLLGFDSVDFGVIAEPSEKQTIRFRLLIQNCILPPGKYALDLFVKNYSKNIHDHFEHLIEFEVEQTPVYGNRLYEPNWHGRSIVPARIEAEVVI